MSSWKKSEKFNLLLKKIKKSEFNSNGQEVTVCCLLWKIFTYQKVGTTSIHSRKNINRA